jgi:FtsH-binding integral membrane protein
MNEIAFILALLGLPGLLLLFVKTLKKNEHQLLKLFLLFAFISVLLLVPKFLVDNNDYCTTQINQTITTDNVTTYDYGQFCITNTKETSNILFKSVTWIIRIIWVYVFVYLSYFALNNLNNLWRGKFKK